MADEPEITIDGVSVPLSEAVEAMDPDLRRALVDELESYLDTAESEPRFTIHPDDNPPEALADGVLKIRVADWLMAADSQDDGK